MQKWSINRRRLLGMATSAVVALMGACIAAPAVGYILAPFFRRRGRGFESGFEDVGAVDDIPIGSWHLLSLALIEQNGWDKRRVTQSIWIRRRGPADSDIEVLSPICPHLGCHINWQPDATEFICPCHGGTFNSNGKYLSGPPPRSMDPLEHRVNSGRLLVRWQDFKNGAPERIPVLA